MRQEHLKSGVFACQLRWGRSIPNMSVIAPRAPVGSWTPRPPQKFSHGPDGIFGPDGIHGKIFKNCSHSLAYPLSLILKVSYNTENLPKEWKLANVVPIHKNGQGWYLKLKAYFDRGPSADARASRSNSGIKRISRPISLTCLVMQLFERILKEELLLIMFNRYDTIYW